MGKRRFIGLHVQADYPLESIKTNVYYQVTFLRVKSSIKKITLPYGFMVSLSYHT